MSLTDTAIIGAGPYGLSLATHLKASGIPHQIFGHPMHAWRDFMPPGMIMRSEAFASSLYAPQRGYTVEDYCRLKGIPFQRVGMALPLETFVDYALWFQSNLIGDVRAVDVVDMQRTKGLFHLKLSDGGALTARTVVIALGLKGFEQTPPVLQGLPGRYVSHSVAYGNLTWAQDRDIAIVGGGQSALGLAALLNELGARVHVLVRDASVRWLERPDASRGLISRLLSPDAGLGRGWACHVLSEFPQIFHLLDDRRRRRIIEKSFGPSGAWWLRDRVVDKVRISFRTEVRHAAINDDRVVLRVRSGHDESYVTADHVIAATGFKTDMRLHRFLSKEIVEAISRKDGLPDLTQNFETNVRGLYVIGPATAHRFGPVMRFVYGAKHAAPRVARHIGSSVSADSRDGVRSAAESPIAEVTNQQSGTL
ncbi:NAD(P)-binding domain-containing protein [Trinickia mobilis]|uniref:NAD(P)-binding domain-containing protein n=1 Tax=Trinickia mobilis TaxID=2816356 RepID=UPI001A8EEFBE|nr:NAD(P)-binding domain-containing protein [Trinickia mobilis]